MKLKSGWRPVQKSADTPTFFQRVAKGIITPQDVQVNQTLVPELVDSFIQAVIDQTPFLGKISSHRLNRLTGNVNVLDIAARGMVSKPEGTAPTDNERLTAQNIGKKYDCKSMQTFFALGFSTISDNADNPRFEQDVDNKFAIAVGNDVLDLAWNGTSDAQDGDFLTLNKGWLQIAEDAASATTRPTHEVTVAAGTTMTAKCDALIDKLPDKYKATAVFIMSRSSKEQLIREIGTNNKTATLVITGEMTTYMGYPIEVTAFIPDGRPVLTPLTNLAWGINRNIQMYREQSGEKRAINYTFDMAMDFEIAINDAFAYVLES